MADVAVISEHEVSHGIVALELGFDKFERVFIDLRTPLITRRGGVDIVIDELQERFDTARPVEERRDLAVKVIAVFAAGREGEILLGHETSDDWCSIDEEMIAWFGLAGVCEDGDLELLAASSKRDNGWAKWDRVDLVIAEGRALAAAILKMKIPVIRNAAKMLHQSVISMGGKGYITQGQLSRIMGRPPTKP
jgi:hypothetical protein